MNYYTARATSDWGSVFDSRQVKASSFGTAIARAGKMAYKESRKRPKMLSITVSFVGSEKRLQDKAEQQ